MPNIQLKFLLLLFCILLILPAVKGTQCLPNLKNIAVYEGALDIIMNLTADPQNVKWKVYPTSDELGGYTVTESDGKINQSLAGLYYLNRTGLVILNATTTENGQPFSTAGLYIAQCVNSTNMTAAKLLVVRQGGPECSCKAGSSTSATLSCSVIYADNANHPIDAIMTWKVNGVVYTTETPVKTRIDQYVLQSTSNIRVNASVPQTYTCLLQFSEPKDIQYPYIATNAPEFNASCSVSTGTNCRDQR